MGSIYPRGRIYWLKYDTIPRETLVRVFWLEPYMILLV